MTQVSVKIPGKVMLAGEYSVLFGGSALAATVKNQMDIVAETHADGRCLLDSALLNDKTEFSTADEPDGPFALFFTSALSGMRRHNIPGASITVKGDLQPEYGFGSSSALRLGTAIALKTLANGPKDTYWEEAQEAYKLQKKSQSQASGYDIVTQYIGGLTMLTPDVSRDVPAWPGRVTVFPSAAVARLNQIVHVFVGGKGAPTTTTIKSTLSWLKEENLLSNLNAASEKLIAAFQAALYDSDENKNLMALLPAVCTHRRIFEGAPSFPRSLLTALEKVEGFGTHFSFKTTGAGGEDSVLLIGLTEHIQDASNVLKQNGWSKIDSPFSESGTEVVCSAAKEGVS